MNKHNKEVTAKMITGAETGGQVYGQGRWNDVKVPKIGREVTLTLGAYQFYGDEGQVLLRMIYKENPNLFSADLVQAINNIRWVSERWVPDQSTRNRIGEIISSELGIKKQIELFCDIQLPAYIRRAEEFGVLDDKAQMMWVEIEHVGGTKAAKRIFSRCDGDYSLDKIMWSLKQDQYDKSSDNQAGDPLYWSRHTFCRRCIEQYATSEEDDSDVVYVKVGD